jgi:hypothetical protein
MRHPWISREKFYPIDSALQINSVVQAFLFTTPARVSGRASKKIANAGLGSPGVRALPFG